MTDEEFERLLELSIKEFGYKYINYDPAWDEPFEFSAEFEEKIQKIIDGMFSNKNSIDKQRV